MNVIIILNYNDYDTTNKYIDLISDYSSLDKIVVVDNCSTDGSFEKLSQKRSNKIHVIKTCNNNGYAYGNNYGMKYAIDNFSHIDNIIISNPDIVVTDETISLLTRTLSINSNIFAVTPLILDKNNAITRNFAWKKPTYSNLLISCSSLIQGICRIFFKYSKFYDQSIISGKKLLKVDILPGCFFLASLDKIKKVGGFDESTFLYFEEDILFSKALELGFENYVVCDDSLCHLEGVSIKKSLKKYSIREKVYRDSCSYYMKEILKCGRIKVFIYKVLNVIFIPERFIYTNYIKGRAKLL